MFVFVISAVLVISPALGRPQGPAPAAQGSPQQSGSTPIPIVSQSEETKEDGGFSYSFETGNGIKVEETGTLKQAAPGLQGRSAAGGEGDDSNNTYISLQGSFSYTAPDGQLISVRYIADENGFQPEGDHIPTPPPGFENALQQHLGAQTAQPGQQQQYHQQTQSPQQQTQLPQQQTQLPQQQTQLGQQQTQPAQQANQYTPQQTTQYTQQPTTIH